MVDYVSNRTMKFNNNNNNNRISHFSGLAGKYSPILGCSNKKDYIIIIIIIIIIYCNWVVTRWQWLFYMYTKYEIVYY